MAKLIVRELDEAVIEALKTRAEAHGRSLEQELRLLLSEAARPTRDEVRRTAAAIRALHGRRVEVDLEELVGQDRSR